MDRLAFDKGTLRKFGWTMAIVFCCIAAILFFRHKPSAALYLLAAAGAFSVAAAARPGILKPVYSGWMRFGFILGWVNTRIILAVLFYLIFTPIGLAMRLFHSGAKGVDNRGTTYWKEKEKAVFDPLTYERRF